MQLIHLQQVTSTNNYLKHLYHADISLNNTAIVADCQTMGRGQGSKNWSSEAGKNLLSSFFRHTNILPANYFNLSMAFSIIVCKTLSCFNIDASVKWPNDIYHNNKKLGGILIENIIMGNKIEKTLLGLGLNVNQLNFPGDVPNPVSMKSITGKNFEVLEVFDCLAQQIEQKYDVLCQSENLLCQYYSILIGYKTFMLYKSNNKLFEGEIIGIQANGQVIINDKTNNTLVFNHGEMQLVLK